MRRQPTAAILTEAGAAVGMGHLTRCVALYDALESLGHVCKLTVAGEAPAHIVGTRSVTLFDWRGPDEARATTVDADVAVIDSYVADIDVYRTVAETASAAVYLDDTARLPYPKGIVVNGNPEATSLGFTAGPETTLLLGVEYQLLRSEFTDASHHEVNPSVTRILVISGGSDAGNVRDALATIASSACQNAIVDVVRESRTASELRDAMLAADIALTAAGQTIYELAATGTPTIAVCVADNQIAQARAFERAGALAYAGEWGDRGVDERVAFLLGTLDPLDTREAMSLAGRALVDGTGARLVAKTCIEIAAMKTGDKGGA